MTLWKMSMMVKSLIRNLPLPKMIRNREINVLNPLILKHGFKLYLYLKQKIISFLKRKNKSIFFSLKHMKRLAVAMLRPSASSIWSVGHKMRIADERRQFSPHRIQHQLRVPSLCGKRHISRCKAKV